MKTLRLTTKDEKLLRGMKIATDMDPAAVNDLAAELAHVPATGFVDHETARANVARRFAVAEEPAVDEALTDALLKLGASKEREEILQRRLDDVAYERDAAVKRAARWELLALVLAWLLFCVVVIAAIKGGL